MIESTLRQSLCQIGHRMWLRGLVAGFDGNMSVRLPRGRFLCTPTAISKGFMTPGQLCVIDASGKPLKKTHKPTSEILLHLQLYAARPDVHAILHAHPPHATAFACSGIPLPEGIYPEADLMLGRVPTVPYSTPGYRELGQAAAAATTAETRALILASHGTVHLGKSLEETLCSLEVLDAYCKILLDLRTLGQVAPPSAAQIKALLEHINKNYWPDSRLGDLGSLGHQAAPYLRTFRKP